jgi:hypothetical protein
MKLLSKDSNRIRARIASAVLGLAVLGAGCSLQKQPPVQQEADKQALAEDSLHMARLYSRWSEVQVLSGQGAREREMPLDLSDAVQYRFVVNRLKATGSTAENSPQLFKRIEQLRQHRALPSRPDTGGLQAAAADAGQEREACSHLMGLSVRDSASAERARFEAFGLATCKGGGDYLLVDVAAFTTNAERTRFRLLGSEFLEGYAEKAVETSPLHLELRTDADEFVVVDSVALAFSEETGDSFMSYSMDESSVVALELRPDPGQGTDWPFYDHPRELIGSHMQDNAIRTCLERGAVVGYLDCDYVSGHVDAAGVFQPFTHPFRGISAVDPARSMAGHRWHPAPGNYWEPVAEYDIRRLYLPLEGRYSVRLRSIIEEPCRDNTFATNEASLVLMESGGRCRAGTQAGTTVLRSGLPFTGERKSLGNNVWQLPFRGLADFGLDCLDYMQNTKLYAFTRMRVCTRPIMNSLSAEAGSTSSYILPYYPPPIYNIDWRNLCLAEGTQVLKADGTSVPVEEVRMGDKLLANASGLTLTVTTLSRGGEHKPLVKLRDEAGEEVMVTETHPMVTARRGVVQALELKTGDEVLTRAGSRTLAAVERVPYDGQVYTVALGTPEELAQVGPEARTLYANGFLVGDSFLQTKLERERKLDAREVLARLDSAWHQDFRLHQKKLQSARR